MPVRSLNKDNFHETIKNSPVPVLVDFYADWCMPCRHIAPFLEEIATEKEGQALVCKVNIDENQSLAEEFSVMSIPLVLSFKNGKVHKQALGAVPKEKLLDLIN
jgi:thioredoxin 1